MKKKTITLICSNIKTYSALRLIEECKKLGQHCHILDTKDLVLENAFNYPSNLVINRATSLNFDDLDLALLSHFESKKIECRNSLKSFERLRNKERQLIELKNLGAPYIPSLHVRGPIDLAKLQQIDSSLMAWDKNKNLDVRFKDHYILKTLRGNKGVGVNIIRGKDSLFSILETFWALGDQRLILQPYLYHAKEYRIFYIKDQEPIIIEKTQKENSFRSNAQRAKTKWLKKYTANEKLMIDLAVELGLHFNLFYAGFDMWFKSNGDLVIGEINPVPGFENIEELTGKNIAREILV